MLLKILTPVLYLYQTPNNSASVGLFKMYSVEKAECF